MDHWRRRGWDQLLGPDGDTQLGALCPQQETVVLNSHLLGGQGGEPSPPAPLWGSTFQITSELEVKKKVVSWLRDMSTVWSSLHLNIILTRHLLSTYCVIGDLYYYTHFTEAESDREVR